MTLYDVLEVSPTASKETIQAAFRAMAKKYHPDVNPSTEEWMKTINAAYEILMDDEQRMAYDAEYINQDYSNSQIESEPGNIEESLKFVQKWPKWLRWVLVLPIAFLTQWIARVFINYALQWTWGISQDGLIPPLVDCTIITYLFVIVIACIVPKYKFIISIIVSILLGILYVMAFTTDIMYQSYYVNSLFATIIVYLSAIITLAVSCIQVNKKYKKS